MEMQAAVAKLRAHGTGHARFTPTLQILSLAWNDNIVGHLQSVARGHGLTNEGYSIKNGIINKTLGITVSGPATKIADFAEDVDAFIAKNA